MELDYGLSFRYGYNVTQMNAKGLLFRSVNSVAVPRPVWMDTIGAGNFAIISWNQIGTASNFSPWGIGVPDVATSFIEVQANAAHTLAAFWRQSGSGADVSSSISAHAAAGYRAYAGEQITVALRDASTSAFKALVLDGNSDAMITGTPTNALSSTYSFANAAWTAAQFFLGARGTTAGAAVRAYTGAQSSLMVLHFPGDVPAWLDWKLYLWNRQLLIDHFHPDSSRKKDEATLVACYGQMLDSGGNVLNPVTQVDYASSLDFTTSGAKGLYIEDAMHPGSLPHALRLYCTIPGGAATPLVQYRNYRNCSIFGDQFNLDFAQDDRRVRGAGVEGAGVKGAVWVEATGSTANNSGTGIMPEVAMCGADGERNQFPLKMLALAPMWIQASSAFIDARDLYGYIGGSEADYHEFPNVTAAGGGIIHVDQPTHSNTSERPAASLIGALGDMYFGAPTWTKIDSARLDEYPTWHHHDDNGFKALIPGTYPIYHDGDYDDDSIFPITNNLCGTYSKSVAPEGKGVVLTSGRAGVNDTGHIYIRIVYGDGSMGRINLTYGNSDPDDFVGAAKPAGWQEMPGGGAMCFFLTRMKSGGGDSTNYWGIAALFCADVLNADLFSSWYNPLTGVRVDDVSEGAAAIASFDAPYRNRDLPFLHTILNTNLHGYFGTVNSDPDGNVFGVTARHDAVVFPVHNNQIEATERFFFYKRGWNPTTRTWAESGEINISSWIAARNHQLTWGRADMAVPVPFAPVTNLGSMWQTPHLQWLDEERRALGIFWTDANNSPQEYNAQWGRQWNTGSVIRGGVIIDPQSGTLDLTRILDLGIVATKAAGALSCRFGKCLHNGEWSERIDVENILTMSATLLLIKETVVLTPTTITIPEAYFPASEVPSGSAEGGANINTLPQADFILGEDLPLQITVENNSADLSTATATVTIRDSTGAVIVNTAAMTGSGTTERTFLYLLTTGAAQTLTAAGWYRAQYIVTFGSVVDYAYQDIHVLPVPGDLPGNCPSVGDILAKISAVGITLRDGVDDSYIQGKIDAVMSEFTQATKREFVETGEVTRYYDGSGTGRQVVDPMVSLTSVEFIGYSPIAPLFEMTDVFLENRQGYPRNQLLIRQGGLPAYGYWVHIFPQGRANIAVTGTFGYAETVPPDVCEAIAGEVADRLAMEVMFSQGGRLESWKEADVEEKYRLLDDATGMYWHKNFLRVIHSRRKPFQERLSNLRAPMV